MQDDNEITQQVMHLYDVEKLSRRQIARQLGIDRKRVRKILGVSEGAPPPAMKKTNLDKFMSLIGQWYQQYPRLMAQQVYERLLGYGYAGSYTTVKRATREYRRPKVIAYHPLVFNPGQEAQVDWFFFKNDAVGAVAGFLYVLSYSRYAWGIFYPRTTFEFFLAGHLECYKHIGGLPHGQRYDNLSSVVKKRTPQEVVYNPNFLDFARFYGFSIHVCNPYSGNEKGRVERLIRNVRGSFLDVETFTDLADLNRKFHGWLERYNSTTHRSTGRTPKDLFKDERLKRLPINIYPAKRTVTARVTKTALVEFETNKYSVPTSCAGKTADITAYISHIEIRISGGKVASHKRCFGKKQLIQNPLHAEKLLNRSPKFRPERIRELITGMDPAFKLFIEKQDDDSDRLAAAQEIFQWIRHYSRGMVLSAVRELNGMGNFRIKALASLLCVPDVQDPPMLWPKDAGLLNLDYEERNLKDYDPDTTDL